MLLPLHYLNMLARAVVVPLKPRSRVNIVDTVGRVCLFFGRCRQCRLMVIGAVEGQSEVDVAKQAGTLVRACHYVLRYAMAKNALLFTDQYLYSAELDKAMY